MIIICNFRNYALHCSLFDLLVQFLLLLKISYLTLKLLCNSVTTHDLSHITTKVKIIIAIWEGYTAYGDQGGK